MSCLSAGTLKWLPVVYFFSQSLGTWYYQCKWNMLPHKLKGRLSIACGRKLELYSLRPQTSTAMNIDVMAEMILCSLFWVKCVQRIASAYPVLILFRIYHIVHANQSHLSYDTQMFDVMETIHILTSQGHVLRRSMWKSSRLKALDKRKNSRKATSASRCLHRNAAPQAINRLLTPWHQFLKPNTKLWWLTCLNILQKVTTNPNQYLLDPYF